MTSVLAVAEGWFRPWLLYAGVAVVLWAAWAAARRWRGPYLGLRSEFLCDDCKYNEARYCSLPDRPNAKHCKDYRSRS